MQFVGDFETHVTVTASPTAWPDLVAWAETERVKVTHIVLDRGRVCSQPILTVTGSGTLATELLAARKISRRLSDAGFEVVRVKIEAEPHASGVPQDDEEARRLPAELHFEHHVKVHLPQGHRREELAELVIPHQAHLSRNARRTADDGGQELFVTQRCFGEGLPTATRRLAALRRALEDAQVRELSVEQEFVVFDSNLSVDDGWLPATGLVDV